MSVAHKSRSRSRNQSAEFPEHQRQEKGIRDQGLAQAARKTGIGV
jgi:hypothetical protein